MCSTITPGCLRCYRPREVEGGRYSPAARLWAEPHTVTGSDGTCDPNITARQTDWWKIDFILGASGWLEANRNPSGVGESKSKSEKENGK